MSILRKITINSHFCSQLIRSQVFFFLFVYTFDEVFGTQTIEILQYFYWFGKCQKHQHFDDGARGGVRAYVLVSYPHRLWTFDTYAVHFVLWLLISFIYAQCLTDLALTYRLTACIVRFGYEFWNVNNQNQTYFTNNRLARILHSTQNKTFSISLSWAFIVSEISASTKVLA